MSDLSGNAFPAELRGFERGCTKRELFAAIALVGVVVLDMGSADRVARDAIRFADALLAELAKTEKNNG